MKLKWIFIICSRNYHASKQSNQYSSVPVFNEKNRKKERKINQIPKDEKKNIIAKALIKML
jgi:hypothetical protein